MATKKAMLPPSLMDGTGWTPEMVLSLRTLMGSDGHPLPREEMGKRFGTTERSIFRWEHGQVRMTPMVGRAIAAWCVGNLRASELQWLAGIAEGATDGDRIAR